MNDRDIGITKVGRSYIWEEVLGRDKAEKSSNPNQTKESVEKLRMYAVYVRCSCYLVDQTINNARRYDHKAATKKRNRHTRGGMHLDQEKIGQVKRYHRGDWGTIGGQPIVQSRWNRSLSLVDVSFSQCYPLITH